MNKPYFSIVITAYNKEKYVKQCISSILNQGMDDFELIIIDDCSTDNTVEIINSFKDKRIKFIHMQTNYGASFCRNHGLNAALGQYILFVDADDWLCVDVLCGAKNELEKNKVDVLFMPYCVFWENTGKYKYSNPKYKISNIKKNKKPFLANAIIKSLKSFNFEVWNKFFSRQFLIENKLKFADISFAEDFAFCFDFFTKAKTYSYIDRAGYFYRRGHQNYSKNIIPDLIKSLEHAKNSTQGTIFEKIFLKKAAYILNFWILRLDFDKDLYNFARKLCPDEKIININYPLDRFIYKIYFKIAK